MGVICDLLVLPYIYFRKKDGSGGAIAVESDLFTEKILYGMIIKLGRAGEKMAARFLEKKGYKLLSAGWKGANCEIDIIAKDGDDIVFVEVKTRRTRNSGYPEESVTPVKKAHIARGAEAWLAEQNYSGPWRADVVAISLLEDEEPEIVHFVGI